MQWWERLPPTNVSRVRFPDLASHVGWVCYWFSFLLRGFFSGFSSFPPFTKTNTPNSNSIRAFDHHVMWKYLFYFILFICCVHSCDDQSCLVIILCSSTVLILTINSCNMWECSGMYLHQMTDWRIFKKLFTLNVVYCASFIFEYVLNVSFWCHSSQVLLHFFTLQPIRRSSKTWLGALNIQSTLSQVNHELCVTGKPRALCGHDGRGVWSRIWTCDISTISQLRIFSSTLTCCRKLSLYDHLAAE